MKHDQPRRRARLNCALVMVALGATACNPSFDIPEASEIRCDASNACPKGYACNDNQGRCVALGSDTAPPSLVTPPTPPEVAQRQRAIDIAFTASERLSAATLVALRWGANDDEEALAVLQGVDDAAAATPTYSYRYQPSGVELQGVPVRLSIKLVDAADNSSEAHLEDFLRFDFAAPRIVSSEIRLTTPDVPLPAAAKAGSEVLALFYTDEPLVEPRQLTTAPDSGLLFELVRASDAEYLYRAVLAGDAYPQGSITVTLAAQDEAGNAVLDPDNVIGSFSIDTVAPAAPLETTPDDLRLERLPWGRAFADETFVPPQTTLYWGAQALAAEGTALLVQSVTSSGQALQQWLALADPTLAGSALLSRSDLLDVSVQSFDDAGNASALVPVRHGTWVATLEQGYAREGATNPHSYRFSKRGGALLFPDDLADPDPPVLKNLGKIGDTGAPYGERKPPDWHQFGGSARWIERKSWPDPIGKQLSAAAFSPARNEWMVFGGATPAGYTQDTLRWSEVAWQRLSTLGAIPSPRMGAAMVYDPGEDRYLLFGGLDDTGPRDDLWQFKAGLWTQLDSSGVGPPRFGHAMALDLVRGHLVIFGGCDTLACTAPTDSHVRFDLGAEVWAQHNGTKPSGRTGHSLVFDPIGGRFLMFGGCASGLFGCAPGELSSELWQLKEGTWSDLTATLPMPPSPRAFHGAAIRVASFDDGSGALSDRSELYVYGGTCATGTPACGDLWRLDDSGWSEVIPNDLVPPARSHMVMAFESANDDLLIFGGGDGSMAYTAIFGDTWRFSPTDSNWRQKDGAGAVPSPRTQAATALALNPNGALVFGGTPDSTAAGATQATDDLWSWSNGDWGKVISTNQPAGRAGASMCAVSYPDATPSGLWRHSYLFGGDTTGGLRDGSLYRIARTLSSDNRALSGDWTLLCDSTTAASGCSGPVGRRGAAMAGFRPAGSGASDPSYVVLFGGLGPSNNARRDLWQWNTLTEQWQEICPLGNCAPWPTNRFGAQMVEDTHRGVLLLFGGYANNGAIYNDTWQWDGQQWSSLSQPAGCEPNRCWAPAQGGGRLVYEERSAQSWYAGGHLYGPLGERWGNSMQPWRFDGEQWRRLSTDGVMPEPRWNGVFTMTPSGNNFLLFGGENNGVVLGDSWLLPTTYDRAPFALLTFDVAAADLTLSAIERIEIVGYTAGRGYRIDLSGDTSLAGEDADLIGDPYDGVVLDAWHAVKQSWKELARSEQAAAPASPIPEPQPVSYAIDMAQNPIAQPEELISASSGRLYLRLRPAYNNGNGSDFAELLVDYVELRIDYTLPAP